MITAEHIILKRCKFAKLTILRISKHDSKFRPNVYQHMYTVMVFPMVVVTR